MLAKRIIPTMLCRGRTLVKGKQFAGDRSIGHVQQAARVHARRGVDELLILDIGASKEERGPDLEMVRELAAECYIPVTVGGGICLLDDIDALLRAGADKVSICTHATEPFIRAAAEHFGRQAITVVVEHGDESLAQTVYSALQAQDAGAGEVIVQSKPRDGVLCGYDLPVVSAVSMALDVPVIASGGCGTPEHMHEALQAGADAVAAGAMFAFTDHTPRSCAQYLRTKGWEVRL
jgi:imidazole glycerol-phosphate synthase subunit HisF